MQSEIIDDKLNQLYLILLYTYLTLHHRVIRFTQDFLPQCLHELEHSDNEDKRIVHLNQYNILNETINNLSLSELYPLFCAMFIIDIQTIIEYNIINYINNTPDTCFEVITSTGRTGWDYLQNAHIPLPLTVVSNILQITQIFFKNNDDDDDDGDDNDDNKNNKTEIIENMMKQAPCLAEVLQKHKSQNLEHLETINEDIYSMYETMLKTTLESDEIQKKYPYWKIDIVISVLVMFLRKDNHSWSQDEHEPHFLAKMIEYYIRRYIDPMERKLRVLSMSREPTEHDKYDDEDRYRFCLFRYATAAIVNPCNGYTYPKYTYDIFGNVF